MPFGDYEDFQACVRDNSDKRDPEAYCAEIKRSIEGATLTDDERKALERSDCPDGQVHVGGACRPIEDVVETVDAPPSILSTPQHLTLKSLETEPIERIEEGDDMVRFTSVKLLSPGVWSDAGSQTATFYPPEGIENLDPHYDESKHDGPPLNIMHDLDTEAWEAHEASVAGYLDPDTIGHDDEGNKFADLVFDTSTGAGQFADENLQSTLENQGAVGFGGPSVEIPAEGLEQTYDENRGMPRVDGGRLTGAALVMDPASKSVNFAKEAARRPIAMSVGGESGKTLTRQSTRMATVLPEAIRMLADVDTDALDRALQTMDAVTDLVDRAESEGFDSSENTVADLLDFVRGEMDPEEGDLEALQDAADGFLETAEADSLDAASAEAFRDWAAEAGGEMEDYPGKDGGEDDDDDDDDDGNEMQDGEELDELREKMANLSERLEDLEDAMSQAMTADDVDAELEDAKGNKLADAETVQELEEAKAELDRRLQTIEDEPADSKTLADAGENFEPTYDTAPSSESGW